MLRAPLPKLGVILETFIVSPIDCPQKSLGKLPPSRVWVNGRVGLAMSRSIGDGEAKGSDAEGAAEDASAVWAALQDDAPLEARVGWVTVFDGVP